MLVAAISWRDHTNPKRIGTALFWFLFGFSFLFGDLMLAYLGKPLTYKITGVIVLLIAALAGANFLAAGSNADSHTEQASQARHASVQRLGNKLFFRHWQFR